MKKYSNHLASETSPYLLQHAHNPVNWYPWSDEALHKAREEDKPILVSIGYSACHWCHVMERESFENEATAAIMNEHFVNIKIDREERPDLDQVYMDAVQAMTGSGGWPLNVFLMPDGKPFYGGTYFPPTAIYNRPSWTDVLYGVVNAFQNKKEEIQQQAQGLTDYIVQSNRFGQDTKPAGETFTKETVANIFENIMKQADRVDGGFGKAPKFPQTSLIQYLLRYYHFFKDETALQQATLSLDKMIYGGIYDQLGGGFARYSTDTEWLAPHFEKMLYDNALLISVMSEAFQITHNPLYEATIAHTIGFLQRELLSPEHGFYAALDADSEGVEGKFYVWSKAEVEEILGTEAKLFCDYYDVSDEGNWEENNILRVKTPPQQFALRYDMDYEALHEALERSHRKLMAVRDKRQRPLLDDKILLSWNALMNTACSKAFAATGNDTYKDLAIRNMNFLLSGFVKDGKELFHTYKNGQAKISAFLDDYAFLIQALIHLQEITGEETYLLKARALADYVIENFSDETEALFYFTNTHQKDIILRKKEVYDGAIPSGNAVMIHNLHYLGIAFDLPDWKHRARQVTGNLEKMCSNYPTSFGVWSNVIIELMNGTQEIVLTGTIIDDIRKEILSNFIPFKVFQSSSHESNLFPLLSGKTVTSQPLIFHCKDYSCSQPFDDIKLLLRQL